MLWRVLWKELLFLALTDFTANLLYICFGLSAIDVNYNGFIFISL